MDGNKCMSIFRVCSLIFAENFKDFREFCWIEKLLLCVSSENLLEADGSLIRKSFMFEFLMENWIRRTIFLEKLLQAERRIWFTKILCDFDQFGAIYGLKKICINDKIEFCFGTWLASFLTTFMKKFLRFRRRLLILNKCKVQVSKMYESRG